jgi:hypothetical protein
MPKVKYNLINMQSKKRKKEYDKQYYKDNKERLNEYNRQYHKDNKENVLKQKREHYANNKKKFSKRAKKYRADNAEKLKKAKKEYNATHKKETKNRNLRNTYGMTIEQYEYMFNVQEGKCDICGKHQNEIKQPLNVDHDHETNEIRGLLCSKCNRLLGDSNDSPETLLNAVKYLNKQ